MSNKNEQKAKKLKKQDKKAKGTASLLQEEQVQSPGKTMFKNFLSRKLTIIGIVIYAAIFLCCMVLPAFFPMNLYDADSSQGNMKPGFRFMNIPSALNGQIDLIDAGNNYGVAIDTQGRVWMWGELSNRLKQVPQDMGQIVDISAGYEHVVALNDQGEIFTWGSNRHGLERIPADTAKDKIIQVVAGYQISFAVGESGNLYVWGNENLISVDPRAHQGNIAKISPNINTAVALMKDGSVAGLSRKESPFNNVPDEIQGRVVDIASADKACIALLSDNTVAVWGQNEYGLREIPEEIQGQVKSVHAGATHFTVLLQDGSVESWGQDHKGQASAPGGDDYVFVDSDYLQNYAIRSNGSVATWGLKGYLLGTDDFGRDIFPRLLEGGRVSLTVGLISVVIAAVIGISIGGFSGFFGGKVDILLMRFAEIIQAIPFLPFAIMLSYVVGSNVSQYGRVFMIMAIQGALNWPPIARLVRSQILSARENEYVTAAKAMGISEVAIIFKHIFPNIMGSVLVNLTLRVSSSMIAESSLSFIGFGIQEPIPSWGNMLTAALDSQVVKTFWWRWVFPAAALSLATLSIYFIGDGLRDAVDPKSSER